MSIAERFADQIVNAVDKMICRYQSLTKQSMLDYCDLDTIIDGYTLVTKRRTLITYYQVHGSARYMGDTEFVDAIARLELLFNNLLSSSAHALQWVFTREPSRASDELEFYLDPLQHSAKAQGLDQTITGHMLNERKRVL